MSQTDKIIKVIIAAIAIAGIAFMVNAYYPEIKTHGRSIAGQEGKIQALRQILGNLSRHAEFTRPFKAQGNCALQGKYKGAFTGQNAEYNDSIRRNHRDYSLCDWS